MKALAFAKKVWEKASFGKRPDFLFGLLILTVTFIFWFPTRDLPYWWDSVYLTKSAFKFLDTNFSPLVSGYGDFAHPPFLMVLLAFLWKVFGESLLVSHLLMLFFTFLTLYYTYLLGKEVMEDEMLGRWLGFFSSLLLLVSPVFLAQVGIVYFEIPVAAFCVAAIYYFIRGNLLAYVGAATLMILTKEVAVVVVGLLLGVVVVEKILHYLDKKSVDFEEVGREVTFVLTPLFFLFLWFIYHRQVAGWMFVRPGREFGKGLSFSRVPRVFKFVFLEQNRFILTLSFIFMGVGALYRKDFRRYFKKPLLILILVPVLTSFFFGMTEFLHRYILFSLPFFFVAGLYLTFKVLEMIPGFKGLDSALKVTILGFLCLFLFYLSYTLWDSHRRIANWRFSPLEENLEYRDVIRIGQDMVDYVEDNYPDKVIWTSFPANYMLSDPRQHFASKDIKVKNCNEYKKGDRVDIVVFHVFSPPSQHCLALIKSFDLSLLTPFSRNGKWMQVFKNPDLNSP